MDYSEYQKLPISRVPCYQALDEETVVKYVDWEDLDESSSTYQGRMLWLQEGEGVTFLYWKNGQLVVEAFSIDEDQQLEALYFIDRMWYIGLSHSEKELQELVKGWEQ